MSITDREIEAANRAEATALLISCGYRVYRPEVDVAGEDLLVRSSAGDIRAVQLKGRMLVDYPRYGNADIWMLFPDRPWAPLSQRSWFMVPHDELYQYLLNRHGEAKGWKKAWSKRDVPNTDRPFLNRHKLRVP